MEVMCRRVPGGLAPESQDEADKLVKIKAGAAVRVIDASTRRYPNAFAIVDASDYDRLAKFKWTATAKTGKHRSVIYAVRHVKEAGRSFNVRMHCEVMGEKHIDHLDGDGLNNSRSNLRACTNSQNQQNRKIGFGASQFKGVSWHKATGKWRATIVVERKQKALGYYRAEEDAARAYDAAAVANFGQFASPNFGGTNG